ncbi:hypothetical protein CCYA_CCYA15G3970 [Cyanidiococcus yangmingshanensis]|nr:hypothetical protein CCYA_CCYA15G3970 [Cyanidiococcus yangmingshanensis]
MISIRTNWCMGASWIQSTMLVGLLCFLVVLLVRERLRCAVLERRLQRYLVASRSVCWPKEGTRFDQDHQGQVLSEADATDTRTTPPRKVRMIKSANSAHEENSEQLESNTVYRDTGEDLCKESNSKHAIETACAAATTQSASMEQLAETSPVRRQDSHPNRTLTSTELEWRQVAEQEAVKRRRAERQSLRLYQEWLEFLAEHSDHVNARHWALERLRWGRRPQSISSFLSNSLDQRQRKLTSPDREERSASPLLTETVSSEALDDASLETSLETLSVLRDIDEIQRQTSANDSTLTYATRDDSIASPEADVDAALEIESTADYPTRSNAHNVRCSALTRLSSSHDAADSAADRNVAAARPRTRSGHLALTWQHIHESEQAPNGVYHRPLDMKRPEAATWHHVDAFLDLNEHDQGGHENTTVA